MNLRVTLIRIVACMGAVATCFWIHQITNLLQSPARKLPTQPPPPASALGRSSRDIFTTIYTKRTGGVSAGPAWDAPFASQAAPFDELDVQELLLELEHTLGRDISEANLRATAGLAHLDDLAHHLTPSQVVKLMDQAQRPGS